MTARNLVLASIESLFDSNGLPVTGTLTAYVKGTQTLANIWDVDGQVLANPLTVVGGIVKAFVAEDSLTLILKNTSGGVERTETWLYPTVAITHDGANIPSYETVAAMKAANVTGTVSLLGYLASGDKPLVYYKALSERTTETPDDGYIIRGTYKDFVMLSNFIDVRDYGMFPSASAVDAHSMYNASKWSNMATRSNALGTPLHLSSGYYEVPPALTLSLVGNGTICPNGTLTRVDIGNSPISFAKAWSGTAYITGAITELAADSVNTSSVSINISSYEVKRLVVDSNAVVNAHDCGVYFTVNHSANRQLTNCTIYSANKIEDAVTEVYTNCELSQSYFAADYAWAGTYNGCVIGLFTDAAKLAALSLAMGNTIDLKGLILGSAGLTISKQKVTISNGTITGAVTFVGSNGSLELVNMSLTSSSVVTGATTITAVNSTILGAYGSAKLVVINNGDIAASGTIHGTVLNAGNYMTESMTLIKPHGTSIGVTGKYKFVRGTDYVEVNGFISCVHINGLDSKSYFVVGYWDDNGTHKNVYVYLDPSAGHNANVHNLYKCSPYTIGVGSISGICYWKGQWGGVELGSEVYTADY